MPSSRDEVSTFFLVLRRVRGTLIGLILIYAISVLGLTLVPGPAGPDGQTTYLSFFHAFYFVSYTATTIGFGEIPYAFSEQQRLWVLCCIYLSVIGWAVFIGKLLQMAQDTNLQRALRSSRFGRDVRKLHEPFYIVCGYGETGRRICAALDRLGWRAVVLEIQPERLADIELHNFSADIPNLVCDAADPSMLHLAGLQKKNCRGLIALTNHDPSNLAIAITGRLLAPALPVLARAEHIETSSNLASFDTRHIINPFERFASYLTLALRSPAAYHLLVWLTGLPGTTLQRHRDPPAGPWVLCGFGSFSRELAERIAGHGLPVTVIDLHAPPAHHLPGVHWVQGDATCAPALLAAGIQQAVGVIAVTGNDISNLSAVVTARQLNPALFAITRQSHTSHQPLFESLHADITMVPSEVIAHECLAILTTPKLAPFLEYLQRAPDDWCETLLHRLTHTYGWTTPEIWSLRLNAQEAPALHRVLMQKPSVRLCDVLHDPAQREHPLTCDALQLDRDDAPSTVLPPADTLLYAGDTLLLAGTREARSALQLTVSHAHTLEYVLTGRDLPGGWIWQYLERRHGH